MGDTVVYRSVSENRSRTFEAVCSLLSGVIYERTQHETKEDLLQILCQKHDVDGISNPAVGDWLKWNGDHWDYKQTVASDGATFIVQFSKVQLSHHGHNRPPSL